MYQRKDGLWCDTLPRQGKSPKFFYGKTKNEVKRKMAKWQEEQVKADCLSHALDEWLDYKEKLVSYNTYEGYKAPIKRLKDAFGTVSLTDLTAYQIHAFLQSLADKGYGKTSVSRHYDVLNGVYKYYINKQGSTLRYNPCTMVTMPTGLKSKPRELADEKDIEIIKASVDVPFGLYAYLLVYTGLRRCEALALTDKSFHDGVISVRDQVVWQPNQPVISKLKTESSNRDIPILAPLDKVLPRWSGYLFSLDGGKTPLTEKQFYKLWRTYCQEAGLADKNVIEYRSIDGRKIHRTEWTYHLVPHQIRHEFATICLDAELPPKDAADLLGHSTPYITEKTYQHIRDSRRQKSTEKLEAFLANG